MIQKFVDLVNETVDESFVRGIDLFLENVNDELILTHKIINEGLETVVEHACSAVEDVKTEDSVNSEIDALTENEIMNAMEEIGGLKE